MKTKDYENVKAIAFDFWDVFAKMNPPMYKFLKRHNIQTKKYFDKIHPLIIAHDIGKINEKQFLQLCSKVMGIEIPYPQYRYTFKKDSLNRNLIRIITRLKKKYKIALLTNNNKEYCEEYLFKPKLNKLFDVMVISYRVGYRKPNPKIYKILIKKLKLKPKEILFIDDDSSKFPPAEKLGIKTLVYRGKKTDNILSKLL